QYKSTGIPVRVASARSASRLAGGSVSAPAKRAPAAPLTSSRPRRAAPSPSTPRTFPPTASTRPLATTSAPIRRPIAPVPAFGTQQLSRGSEILSRRFRPGAAHILRQPAHIEAAGIGTWFLRSGLSQNRIHQFRQKRRVGERRGTRFEFTAHQHVFDGSWVEH